LLREFKYREPARSAPLLRGYPINGQAIGSTPTHWQEKSTNTLEEQILFVLLSSLLGDVFGWGTQQGGYLVHDVLPMQIHENEQISTGSEQVLVWHIEDAFHPYYPDYVGLMCLRNPDRTPTLVSALDITKLSMRSRELLSEPRFIIRPDESHRPKNVFKGKAMSASELKMQERAYHKIEAMMNTQQKVPVLFGDFERPYMRIDPYFMLPVDYDPPAAAAVAELIELLDDSIEEVILQAGDFIFVDNYRAVHGRKSFKAKYDGTDRWLKRVVITRNLRASREARAETTSRVVYI